MTAPTQAPNANSLLMGSGVTAAKFDSIGTTVGGVIVREPVTKQQTDFDSGAPKTFDNGDPMWQIIVHVQTNLRDPQTPNDDGIRALYLKGQLMGVAREAVKAIGAPGLEVGGELHVTYTGSEPNSRGRGNDKKVYAVRYLSPANAVLMAPATTPVNAQSAPVFAAPQPAPVYAQPVAAPVYVQPAAGAPAGIDPAVWAQLDPNQRAQYLAATTANASIPPF